MRRSVSLVLIFVLSYGVALLVTPPDAFTFHLTAASFCVFGVLGYVLGLWEARLRSHVADKHDGAAKPRAV